MIGSMTFLRFSIVVAIVQYLIIVNKIQLVSPSAVNTIEWNDLESRLSIDATFTPANLDDWLEQCLDPFTLVVDTGKAVSNHDLYKKPSGLCMNTASCAFIDCHGPLYNDPSFNRAENIATYGIHYAIDPISDEQSDELKSSEELNLPMTVVHPKHVGDISETIKFSIANRHSIEGISVKTSGHSYTGASTKKNTILINLSKFTKYTHTDEATFVFNPESLVECQFQSDMSDAFLDACKLAIAKNKQAVLRVGGGQIWDQALRAVEISWNKDSNNPRKYHIVSGAAGTVSAAGGWVQSGGLSGTNGMRMFGVGLDQILHIEMVLPDGRHVRFGPSSWVHDSKFMYPQTKHVKGYCNIGDMSDESSWNWSECEKGTEPNFNDLWFAVRGGGGGAFGIVTSLYYQLHDFPKFQAYTVLIPQDDLGLEDAKKWFEFYLRFSFIPESIGVTKGASNSCGHPNFGGLSGGFLVCHNGAGDVMKAAWERFYEGSAGVIWNESSGDSYSDLFGDLSYNYVADNPEAVVSPYISDILGHSGEQFPLSLFSDEDRFSQFLDLIFSCVIEGKCNPNLYLMGGAIPFASDGMTAFPLHRRHNAFMAEVSDSDYIHEFKKLFYEVSDDEPATGDEFPGSICHNHARVDAITPLRDDWTKSCDRSWTLEEQKERCFTFQEATLGTANVKKLEMIHEDVDPHHLFACPDCVGYRSSSTSKKSKKKKKSKDKSKKKKKKSNDKKMKMKKFH